MTRLIDVLLRSVVPLLLALAASAVLLVALGTDPRIFFLDVIRFGLLGDGWQQSLTAMAPLLLVALGLIVAFRAGLWNLSYGGSYLLAAAIVAGIAPGMMQALPFGLAVAVLFLIAFGIGAALGWLPARLKARDGTTEVVTSLMVSFLAMGLASLLIRGPLQDPGVTVPQTRVLPLEHMLPFVPGTRVHVGIVVALVAVAVAHYALMHTSFGVRVDVLGANPRAAAHVGIDVKRLTAVVFLLSSGAIALAAAVDMLGLWGYARAGWNPGYGDKLLPFVFLARLNPLASVPFVAVYAVLATGGTLAAQRAGISVDVLLVIVALVLFFMVLIEALGRRFGRGLGASYLRHRSSDALPGEDRTPRIAGREPAGGAS